MEDYKVNSKHGIWLVLNIIVITSFAATVLASDSAYNLKNLPVKGMVTMIDLGAKKCIPCKMMAPIMEKMEKVYRNKAAIVFIDVWENREQAVRFGIRAIPTQIFFDPEGKEVHRHVGFMSEKEIVVQLKKMGVE
jgi:thioredoxin 1